MKNYIYLLFTLIVLIGCSKDKNGSSINLVKVNEHIVTNKVFGKKSKAFFQLSKDKQKIILERVVDNELLLQSIFDKGKNKFDEHSRALVGLKSIEEEYSKKFLKKVRDSNLSLKFYQKNRSKYYHDELFEISYILTQTKEGAEKILEKLEKSLDSNLSFDRVGEESISMGLAKKSVHLGLRDKRVFPKKLQKAISSMPLNSYFKEPIETKDGFYLVYLHSKKGKGYLKFETQKGAIENYLADMEFKKWIKRKLEELRKDANITYLFKVD
jgi:hypothetical protein